MKHSALFFIIFSAPFCAFADGGNTVPATGWPRKTEQEKPVSTGELREKLDAALKQQNWQDFDKTLEQYRSRFLADQIFADYAEARWRSSKGEYSQAQALYRRVLAQKPDWVQARTAMLDNLSAARSQPRPGDYGRRLQAADVWQLPVTMSYDRSDSIAYASRNRVGLKTGSRPRDGSQVPQTANLLRYNLGAEHDFDIKGNHKLRVGLTSGGTHYWDYYDISSRSVRLAAGYRSSTGGHSWSLTPYTEQSWLGSEKHTLNKGAAASYSNKLNDNWRLSLAASSVNRTFNDPGHAKYYDGVLSSVASTAEWRPNEAWTFSLGTDYRIDQTDNETQASDRTAFRTGLSRKFDNGFNAGASLQYGRREFSHADPASGLGRKDNEYNASASLSYNPRRWKGVTPKVDYRYSKVDSNVDTSSRETSQWFMSLEKRF